MLTRATVIDRYLLRETLAAWLGVTVVLLAIMLATRFARFLAQAAAGQIPREFLLNIVGLSSLQYLVILIPVSLLLAIMLSLGRMYRDQEVAAMTGCGVGPLSLYRPVIVLALCLTAVTAALSFQIGPWAGRHADYLVKDAQRLVQFTPFEAGRFKSIAGGRAVFYTAAVNPDGNRLDTVFALVQETRVPNVVTARHGAQGVDPQTGERVLQLEQGHRYAGEPGQADFDIVHFDTFVTRIAPPEFIYLSSKRKIRRTSELLGSDDPEDLAELQLRIAAPMTVLLLALMAIPLAHASPREGRYGKLVIGLLVYLVYSNLLAAGQTAIAKGMLPATLGLWWVHALFGVLALWLIGKRVGWTLRLRGAPA
jgi:lipopolysaccharide export system permease protein